LLRSSEPACLTKGSWFPTLRALSKVWNREKKRIIGDIALGKKMKAFSDTECVACWVLGKRKKRPDVPPQKDERIDRNAAVEKEGGGSAGQKFNSRRRGVEDLFLRNRRARS